MRITATVLLMGLKVIIYPLIGIQKRAGLSNAQQHADAQLTISGVHNDLRDAVAGTLWAILEGNTVLEAIHPATLSYLQGFQEFTPWTYPIGMSPRRIAKSYH